MPVPQIVFEELLVNALTHRDYFVEAPIRLFVFDDRVELVSPGSLPNHLTVEKIQAGVSVIRNPIIASFVAKGLLPYRGLGTGVRRAVSEWAAIEFKDDRDACTFTAMVSLTKVHQETTNAPKKSPIGEAKSWNAPKNAPINQLQVQLMHLIAGDPAISYDDMAEKMGKDRTTIMRNVQKLKRLGYLRRVGANKVGHWEVS